MSPYATGGEMSHPTLSYLSIGSGITNTARCGVAIGGDRGMRDVVWQIRTLRHTQPT